MNVDAETQAVRGGPLAPVAGGERVEILDVLRGFAVLGILLVNVPLFFSPLFLALTGQQWWPAPVDQAAQIAVVFLAQAKFYALFSFLFGYGLAIQMERAAARGARVGGFFARRLAVLAGIGLAHALFLWFGDILFLYALLGFPLLLFRERKPRTLLVWTILLLAAPVVLQAFVLVLVELGRMVPEGAAAIERAFTEQRDEAMQLVERARAAYSTGTFGEIAAIRAREWSTVLFVGMLTFGTQVLGLFVIGLNLGRRRFFQNLDEHRPRLRRALPWLVAAGVAGSLAQVVGYLGANPAEPSLTGLLATIGTSWGAPCLSAAYVAGVCLLAERPAWRSRLARLASVGRMALTNYLLHSLVFTTLAYSYGFGLYGRVRPSVGLLLAAAMFGLQLLLSPWWLARFRFGPAEWLWRSLTYGSLQPLRRIESAR